MRGAHVYNQVQSNCNQAASDVEQYLPLVKKIAYHLKGRLPDSVFVEDLIQAGVIGLIEALQKYSADQGASFETYAGIRIRGAMLDEIRKGDWTPRSVHRKSREVSEAIRQVEARLGRESRDSEVAQEMGLSLEEYHHILVDTSSAHLMSIDEPDSEVLSEDQLDGHSPSPLAILADAGFKQNLAMLIDELPEKEKLVMALYYDEELNLKEIGLVLEVSESRVSQIHSQAIKRLRARMSGWL
jgi:RNA polymerase sigma factor for flagellar operon FliA